MHKVPVISEKLLLQDTKGKCFLVDFPYSFSGSACSITSFEVCEIKMPLSPTDKITLLTGRRTVPNAVKPPTYYSLDKFKKFYKIVKHVKDETYV